MAKWKTNGFVTRNTITDRLLPAIEGVLVDTGNYGVDGMRSIEASQVSDGSSGRLHDSIMYTTKANKSAMGGAARSDDELDPPMDNGTVHIGSQCPYAPYVEMGSLPHMSAKGHDEFVASLKDWFYRMYGINPDSVEGYPQFMGVYRKIVAQGTESQPFVEPMFDDTFDYMKRKIAIAIQMNRYATRGGRK